MKAVALVLIAVFLVQCIHLNRRISYLPLGKTKMDILSIIGEPDTVYRKNNLDHWMYIFRIDRKEYSRTLFFKRGKMVRKGKPRRHPSFKTLLDDSENFKDYREAIQNIKQN